MKTDKYGQFIFTEADLLDIYLTNPQIALKNVLTRESILFDPSLDIENPPTFMRYISTKSSIEQFDSVNANRWKIPGEYLTLDIAKYVIDRCEGEAELQRAAEELLLFQERDLFMFLRYMKYLVDVMTKNNVVWGVGRGSSVSSFVLYKIGIHRINSLYYDLDISEFLK